LIALSVEHRSHSAMTRIDYVKDETGRTIVGACLGALLLGYVTFGYYGKEMQASSGAAGEVTTHPEKYEILERSRYTIRYRAKLSDRLVPVTVAAVLGALGGAYAARWLSRKPAGEIMPKRHDDYGNPSYSIDKVRMKTNDKHAPKMR
jgi:hypothetical protein